MKKEDFQRGIQQSLTNIGRETKDQQQARLSEEARIMRLQEETRLRDEQIAIKSKKWDDWLERLSIPQGMEALQDMVGGKLVRKEVRYFNSNFYTIVLDSHYGKPITICRHGKVTGKTWTEPRSTGDVYLSGGYSYTYATDYFAEPKERLLENLFGVHLESGNDYSSLILTPYKQEWKACQSKNIPNEVFYTGYDFDKVVVDRMNNKPIQAEVQMNSNEQVQNEQLNSFFATCHQIILGKLPHSCGQGPKFLQYRDEESVRGMIALGSNLS